MTKSLRFSFVILFAILMTACASVPMESPEKDRAAKNARPAPGKALIYVYRNEFFGAAMKMAVKLDGKIAGQTAKETYFMWQVSPGRHVISSEMEGDEDYKLALNCKAGKSYYVWQEIKMGMFSANSKLHLVSPKQGRKGVQECKLIKSQI